MDDCQTNAHKTPVKEPISHEVMDALDGLVKAAATLACRTTDKLHPICRTAIPSGDSKEEEDIEREYPPLFNDMRARLEDIEYSIAIMNDLLDRAEV